MSIVLDPARRLKATVTSITGAPGDIRVIHCRLAEEGALIADPGAHADIYLSDGTCRQYSLLPSEPGAYRFAIKREGNGRGGSRYLHDEVVVGNVLEVSLPRNNFTLSGDAAPSVLVGGGIGITPLYAMVRRLAALHAGWELHYASRLGRDSLFAEELLTSFPGQAFVYGGLNRQRMPLESIIRDAPVAAHFYCCGPNDLTNEFTRFTAARPHACVHLERFHAPIQTLPMRAFTVDLRRSGRRIVVPEGRTLHDILVEVGVDVPASCREGVCGTCEVFVLEGVPDHRDTVLSPQERASNKSMMACCSRSLSETLVLDL